jgi:enamine deaminase RidA (YjgF/YER057c/UK114 family)
MERRSLNPWTWQDPYGFAQAVELTGISRTLLCAGQAAVDAEGHPAHAGDMKAQLQLALTNLEAVLRQADLTLTDVVRLTVYTTDFDAFLAESGLLTARLGEVRCRPVLTGVGVTRLAFPELMGELEATAMK